MKLTDLHPKWITLYGSTVPLYIGITFRCPHCPDGERGETCYLAVYFTNPVDPDNWLPRITPLGKLADNVWNRVGESFENLTLTPSIDASKVGHWHGFITNGEVR